VLYKLVVFDFDGTLADTFPWFASVLNGVADRFGFRKVETAEEVEALRGLSSRQIIERLDVPIWKLPLIARHMRRLASEHAADMRTFEGVPAMLQELHASGARLSVVSSNSEANVRRVLGPESAARVELYACGTSLFGKAAQFRKILSAASVAPSEVLCIGDELRDAEAAAKVGIPFGAVAWGFTRRDALEKCSPHHLFLSVDDILRTLAPAA
jgi:phosphoglycolate phosphatase